LTSPIRTFVGGFKVQCPATRRPGIKLLAVSPSCTAHTTPQIHPRCDRPLAISTCAVNKFAMISAVIAIQLRCNLDFKTIKFNRLRIHNLVAARRIELEAFCGRERSESPQAKPRAKPRDLPPLSLERAASYS